MLSLGVLSLGVLRLGVLTHIKLEAERRCVHDWAPDHQHIRGGGPEPGHGGAGADQPRPSRPYVWQHQPGCSAHRGGVGQAEGAGPSHHQR